MHTRDPDLSPKDLNVALDAIVVSHPTYSAAMHTCMRLLDFTRHGSGPSGACLLGNTGVGKTTLIKQLSAIGNKNCAGHERRVVVSSLTGSTALGAVYTDLLRAMGDTRPQSGDNPDKLRRLSEGLFALQTDILVIDEVQHLMTGGFHQPVKLKEITNALKSLLDKGRTSLILAGMPSAIDIWTFDPQIRRRFLPPAVLEAFEPVQDAQSWLLVIKGLMKCFTDVGIEKPEMPPTEFCDRMMLAAFGSIGTAAKILRAGGHIALDSNSPKLTSAILSEAIRFNIDPMDGDHAAFTMSVTQVRQAIERGFTKPTESLALASRKPTMGQALSTRGAL